MHGQLGLTKANSKMQHSYLYFVLEQSRKG